MIQPLKESLVIRIHEGSILDVSADYIVNPANSFMQHGGGLAAVIDRQAQRDPYTLPEWGRVAAYRNHRDTAPLIPTGGAILGPPGMLPYKGIIHAVGPIWGGGGLHEAELLFCAYRNALQCVIDAGGSSVVFPAISAGIFGVPIGEVAHAAYGAIVFAKATKATRSRSIDVTFALTDPNHVAAFTKTPEADWTRYLTV